MKYIILIVVLTYFNIIVSAQNKHISDARFVIGLSGPELLHAGFTYRILNFSQIGLNGGIGPSAGIAWPAISLEHRLYFGKNAMSTDQKTWFFRQGTTYFPYATKSSQHFSLNLTLGKDFIFKNIRNGITLDAGVFYLAESENSSIMLIRKLNLWPALRFEFYFAL